MAALLTIWFGCWVQAKSFVRSQSFLLFNYNRNRQTAQTNCHASTNESARRCSPLCRPRRSVERGRHPRDARKQHNHRSFSGGETMC